MFKLWAKLDWLTKGIFLCGLAVNLVSIIPAFLSSPLISIAGLPFILWFLVPYFILIIISLKSTNRWVIAGGGILVLIADVLIHIHVLFFPSSSTAAIGLLYTPLIFSIVVLPVGIVLGWVFGRFKNWYTNLQKGSTSRKFLRLSGFLFAGLSVLTLILWGSEILHSLRKIVDVNARIGNPRILSGESLFQKTLIYKGSHQFISAMQVDDLDGDHKNEIVLLAHRGVILIDPDTLHVKKQVAFEGNAGAPDYITDIDNNGVFELIKAGGGFGEVGLLNSNGKTLWIFEPDPTYHSERMIAADLNQDGIKELYVTSDNSETAGLYKLGADGQIIWKKGKWMSELAYVDSSIDKERLIITVGRNGTFELWNAEGKKIREFSPHLCIFKFQIVRWPDVENILTGYQDSKFFIIDLKGNKIFEHKVDSYFDYHGPFGVSVKFKADEKPYLAVLCETSSATGLMQLTIFSPSGELVYKEILKASEGINVINETGKGTEALLLSDRTGSVWMYKLRR